MNILFITYRSLFPQDNGAVVASLSYIQRLISSGFGVDVIAFLQDDEQAKQTSFSATYVPFKSNYLSMLSFRWPLTIKKYYKRDMVSAIKTHLSQKKYDWVFVDHLQTSSYLPMLTKTGIPVILVEHNIEQEIWHKYLKKCNPLIKFPVWINYKRMIKAERKALNSVSAIVSVSPEDKKFIETIAYYKNCFVIDPTSPISEFVHVYHPGQTLKLLFIGSYSWFPNERAALFVENKVCPLLDKRNIDYSFTLVGKGATKEMVSATENNPRIHILGFVDNIDEVYQSNDVFINMIFDGGGINIKLLNSLASGIPVLSSSFGVRGTGLQDKENCLIANSEEECCDILSKVYRGEIDISSFGKKEQVYYYDNIVNSPEFRRLASYLKNEK